LEQLLFLVYDIVFLKEDWCIYVCPYSRVQSVLYDEDTLQAIYDEKRGGKIYDENQIKVIFKKKRASRKMQTCTACGNTV